MPDWSTLPESFQLDSGLREDVTMTIVGSYFAFTSTYMDGKNIRLVLTGYDEDEEPFTQKLGVGADWLSPDQGKTISHPTKKRPNRNSIFGHFLGHALDIPQLQEVIFSRDINGLGARTSQLWLTLVLHLQAKTISFGRGIDPREYLMPTEYLGLAKDSTQQQLTLPSPSANIPTAPPTPSPTPINPAVEAARLAAQQAAPSVPAAATGTGTVLMDRLIAIAQSSATHAIFQEQAFQIPQVLLDDNLANAVADPSALYTTHHQ